MLSFFIKDGGRDVISYVNELKLKRTQLYLRETVCGKLNRNRTHRHTDKQTTWYFPTRTITLHSMTECKSSAMTLVDIHYLEHILNRRTCSILKQN